MIRLTFLLRRKPHLSLSEFHERWLDGHGPLMAFHQTRLQILRYTQTHRLADPYIEAMPGPRGDMEMPYDGVAETWWHSEDALYTAKESATGARASAELLADEAEFIDLPNSPLWLAHEYPQFSVSLEHVVARPASGVVKAHFPFRHYAAMTLTEAQQYWRVNHGPLARSIAPARAMLRYQQVHRFETPLESELRAVRGTLVDTYTGHAEMWYDRLNTRSGPEVVEASRRAFEDESQFIDFARSSMWIGKEHVFVDRW